MRKWSVDLHKLIYTHILMIGVPTLFYYCLRLGGLTLVNVHVAIATFFLFSSLMIILEATNSLFRRFAVKGEKPAKNKLDQLVRSVKSVLRVSGHRRASQPVSRSQETSSLLQNL